MSNYFNHQTLIDQYDHTAIDVPTGLNQKIKKSEVPFYWSDFPSFKCQMVLSKQFF